jgi:hypothetical protein
MIQIMDVNLLVLMYSVQTRFILTIEQERLIIVGTLQSRSSSDCSAEVEDVEDITG